jgi:hypothetical protein
MLAITARSRLHGEAHVRCHASLQVTRDLGADFVQHRESLNPTALWNCPGLLLAVICSYMHGHTRVRIIMCLCGCIEHIEDDYVPVGTVANSLP